MTTNAIVELVFVLLIIGAILLFVARRILRIALKLAFAMTIVLLLVIGAAIGWWRGWFTSSPSVQRPPTISNQRVNTNQRRR